MGTDQAYTTESKQLRIKETRENIFLSNSCTNVKRK